MRILLLALTLICPSVQALSVESNSANTVDLQDQLAKEVALEKQKEELTHNEEDTFSDPIIISLGFNCIVAGMLRNHNLRSSTFPFDWNRTSFQGVCDLLQNDFFDLLNPEYLSFRITRILNTKYTFAFYHDFPADKSVGRNDYVKENFLDYVSGVATKYKRRIDRLNKALNSGHAVYCIRLSSGTRPWKLDPLKQTPEEIIKLRDILLTKFPHSNITLVAVDNDDSYKDDWNLEHIKNFYIKNATSDEEWVEIFKTLGFLPASA